MRPRTHYAKSGDINIAYQVTGDGPVDLVRVPGWISNVDYDWEYPAQAPQIERLSKFSRFIRFDNRGTGLSDREVGYPTLEQAIGDFGAHYNHLRYHESIANLTPADVYYGRGQTILLERERIKRDTIRARRLHHRGHAA